MASISSIFLNTTPQYSANPTIATTSSKNKLNRILTESPNDLMRDNASKEILWGVAKIVTIIGFLTLSCATFVGTSLYAPTYVIIASFGVCLSLPTAADVFSFANERSLSCAQQKIKFARIAEIYSKLDALSPTELEYKFTHYSIFKYDVQDFNHLDKGFKNLIIGLATMIYLSERTEELYQQHQQTLDQVSKQSPPSSHRDQIRTAYYEQRAALANYINAGYMYGLLHHPFMQKSLEEIGSMTMLSAEDYALAHLYKKDDQLPVFVFKKEEESSLEEADFRDFQSSCLTKSEKLSALSHRLFL